MPLASLAFRLSTDLCRLDSNGVASCRWRDPAALRDIRATQTARFTGELPNQRHGCTPRVPLRNRSHPCPPDHVLELRANASHEFLGAQLCVVTQAGHRLKAGVLHLALEERDVIAFVSETKNSLVFFRQVAQE